MHCGEPRCAHYDFSWADVITEDADDLNELREGLAGVHPDDILNWDRVKREILEG